MDRAPGIRPRTPGARWGSVPSAAFDTPDLDDKTLGPDGYHDEVPAEPAAWTYSDGPVPGVVIYGHGFGVRLRLKVAEEVATESIATLGWSPEGGSRWRRMAHGRQVLRGSAWLAHRAPGSRRKGGRRTTSPLTDLNRGRHLRLYSLGVDVRPEGTFLEVQGVRHGDVDRLLHEVLGLGRDNWVVEHYTTAERYIVLEPADALRLAEGLGLEPAQGRGAFSRKQFLVKEHEIEVPIRRRARTRATLNCYRITQGGTSLYRLEARLRGRRRDRQQFSQDDIQHLDKLLLDLVDNHGLSPVLKPALWEPRSRGSRVASAPHDELIRHLPLKARRGLAMDRREVRRLRSCHIPWSADAAGSPEETAADPSLGTTLRGPLSSPRTWTTSTPGTHPMEVTWYLPQGTKSEPPRTDPTPPTSPEEAFGRALSRSKGQLVEVILPYDQDPTPFIDEFIRHRAGRKVGVTVKGTETWGGIQRRLLRDHPLDETVNDMVIVVDVTAVALHRSAFKRALDMHQDVQRAEAQTIAANIWEPMRYLRSFVEGGDAVVLLVTVDLRPEAGKGPFRPSNNWTDARVRSLLGDAGRYWCHRRFLVEREMHETKYRLWWTTTKVVSLQDETEGVPGRLYRWRPAS